MHSHILDTIYTQGNFFLRLLNGLNALDVVEALYVPDALDEQYALDTPNQKIARPGFWV